MRLYTGVIRFDPPIRNVTAIVANKAFDGIEHEYIELAHKGTVKAAFTYFELTDDGTLSSPMHHIGYSTEDVGYCPQFYDYPADVRETFLATCNLPTRAVDAITTVHPRKRTIGWADLDHAHAAEVLARHGVQDHTESHI